MTTIAEQFSNVYLDGMMGEELLGKENRTRDPRKQRTMVKTGR